MDFIDNFFHKQFVSTFPSDPLEVCLTTSNEIEFNTNSKISLMLSLLNSFQEPKASKWKPKFEELPP